VRELILALVTYLSPIILPGWTVETDFADIEAPYQAESYAEPEYLRLYVTYDVEQIMEDEDDPIDVVIHELLHGLFWQLQELAEEHNPQFAAYLSDAAISQLEKVIRARTWPEIREILVDSIFKAAEKVDARNHASITCVECGAKPQEEHVLGCLYLRRGPEKFYGQGIAEMIDPGLRKGSPWEGVTTTDCYLDRYAKRRSEGR
jgi:hypothetical protein